MEGERREELDVSEGSNLGSNLEEFLATIDLFRECRRIMGYS